MEGLGIGKYSIIFVVIICIDMFVFVETIVV